MGSTLDNLKRDYYLSVVPGALPTMTLTDLEYLFYTSPPSGGGGGFTPTAWTDITSFPAGAAATVDPTIPTLQIRKDLADVARIKGRIDFSGIIGAGSTVCTLPAAFAPARIQQFTTRFPTAVCRVQINQDGTIFLTAATAAGNQLYLDGITYLLT